MLRRIARNAYRYGGGHAVSRYRSRQQLRILMYHRFNGQAQHLEAQCGHIRRHYNPVTMDQVSGWLSGQAELPERPLAVTVDDGYRDFLEVAWPCLARYEIPAMVYIVSSFADGEYWLWWDALTEYLIRSASRPIVLPPLAGKQEMLPPSETAERRRQAERLAYALMKVPDVDRQGYLDALPAACGLRLEAAPPPGYAAMNWNEIVQLSSAGVCFGAHTRTHPILARLPGPRQEDEMSVSRRKLEAAIGSPVRHFCYPVGGPDEFNSDSVAAARRVGFATATTTLRGLNGSDADPFQLCRLGVEPDQDPLYFAELLAGVRAI